jgi:CRISPR-associated protein Cmr6
LKANDQVDAVLLEERTKKGGWRARHEPSGMEGPIQNTSDVPADLTPGSRVTLTIASVSPRSLDLRYPTAAGADRPVNKGKP